MKTDTETAEARTAGCGHTPGPWHFNKAFNATIEGRGKCTMIGIGGSGCHIGYVSVTGCVPMEEAQANARLIAAAPDLLAALKRLLRAFEADKELVPTMDILTCWETNSQAVEAARSVIKQAEGRQS